MACIGMVGGNSGIGLALAQRLAKDGHELFCFHRKAKEVQYRWDAREAFPREVLPEVLDGIVYCPGTITLKPFHQYKPEDFAHDWNINVAGAVAFLQACYPALKRAEKARVVLFSSVAAQAGLRFHASIAMAKGAIESLTRSLAAEWAPKIKVNAIAPGLIDTPLSAALISDDKKRENVQAMNPSKMIGSPTHVAELAAWLLTCEDAYITGQIFTLDGGLGVIR